eukprot:2253824-Amphidinium_carterae.1
MPRKPTKELSEQAKHYEQQMKDAPLTRTMQRRSPHMFRLPQGLHPVSYTHLRAHETEADL